MKKNIVYPEALIEIRPSKMLPGEIGVFAVRDLKIGVVVGKTEYLDQGVFLTWQEYEKIDKETKQIMDKYCLGDKDGLFAPTDINYLSIPWNFNHCCDGNVGFDREKNFVIIKNVKKGDELCYDYSLAESNPNFRMTCLCGSKKCRKIITGNDWKNSKFMKNNLSYIHPNLINIK